VEMDGVAAFFVPEFPELKTNTKGPIK